MWKHLKISNRRTATWWHLQSLCSEQCVVLGGRGRSQGIMFPPTWSKSTQKSIKPKRSEQLLCINMEGAGLMTYTAVSHQMAPSVLTAWFTSRCSSAVDTNQQMSLVYFNVWTFASCWRCHRIFDYRSVVFIDLSLVFRHSLIIDRMDELACVSMHGC